MTSFDFSFSPADARLRQAGEPAEELPVTYVFEAAREQLFLGTTNYHYLLLAFVMNLVFIAASYLFMQMMFSLSKKRGSFVRMEN